MNRIVRVLVYVVLLLVSYGLLFMAVGINLPDQELESRKHELDPVWYENDLWLMRVVGLVAASVGFPLNLYAAWNLVRLLFFYGTPLSRTSQAPDQAT